VGNNSDINGWETYQLNNAGYYESQVFLTLKDIYENTSRIRNGYGRWQANEANKLYKHSDNSWNTTSSGSILTVQLPTFETAFWKHG